MKLLLLLFKESFKKSYAIMILSIIAGISEVSSVILTINGVQDVVQGQRLLFYAIFLPVAAITLIISKRISQIQAAELTENFLKKRYNEIVDDIRHAELMEVEKQDASKIYLKMLNAQTMTDAAIKGIHAFQNLLVIFLLWFYVYYISPFGGTVCFLIFAFAAAVYEVHEKLMMPHMQKESEKEKELFSLFDHILYGAKEIRINQQKNNDLFENWLKPAILNVKETRAQILSYLSQYWIFSCACFFIALIFIAFFLPKYHSSNETMSLLILVIYTWTPTLSIIGYIPELIEGKNASEDLYKLAGKDKITRGKQEELYETLENFSELKINNLEFVYKNLEEDAGFSIGPFSLKCKPGEIIIVAGGNGSGKTTLLKILTGLYFPDSGEISINGKPVKLSNHRYLFSTVFSDFHLFDTIFGLDEIETETVHNFLKQTGLFYKTNWIPDEKRFSTINLSTGQRKRLALICSLLEDKPIYIFDEWAADQDPHFRKYFYKTLLPYLREKGKLIIAVSHDDRYFHIADRLIKMEYGKVVYNQSPEKDSSIYSNLIKDTETTENLKYKMGTEKSTTTRDYFKNSTFSRKSEKKQKIKKNQIKELFKSSFKKKSGVLIFSGILSALSPPLKFGTLFFSVNLTQGEIPIKNFFIMIILLTLYIVSFKNFSSLFIWIIEDWIANIRVKVMEQIGKTDFYSFEKAGIEKIQTALTYDMKTISQITNTVAIASRSLFIFAGYFFVIPAISTKAFFIFIAVIIHGYLFLAYNMSITKKLVIDVRKTEKSLFDAVRDTLRGFKELKINQKKSYDFFYNCFKYRNEKLSQIKFQTAKCFINNYTLACSLLQALFVISVLVLPFTGFISNEMLLTFVGFIVCIPMENFNDLYPRVTLSSISMQRLYELGNELDYLERDQVIEKEQKIFKEIKYENIFFQYEVNNEPSFSVGPLSLTFIPGKIIFIIGGNGSGKSTLLNLITGLYPSESGRIILNGEIEHISSCISLFSTIFFDFHLFDRFYGIKNVDTDRVNELLKRMDLDKKVKFEGEKFNTLELSTGQRKRLAMVHAIMEDKPVYIFDEWAADQDPEFRQFFYEELLPSFKAEGKTIIAVSHDDRYFHIADEIVKLEYGSIVEIKKG